MKWHYVITTFSHAPKVKKLLRKCIASLPLDAIYNIYDGHDFTSIAQMWNTAIQKFLLNGTNDYLIILGEDLECIGDTGKILSNALRLGENYNIIMTTAYDVNLHGNLGPIFVGGRDILAGMFCFCVGKKFVEKVGLFDEQYERAWFEDADKIYQLYTLGYDLAIVAPVYHVGEANTKYDAEVAAAKLKYFPENLERYIKKWGGEPSKETFQTPYNKGQHWKN